MTRAKNTIEQTETLAQQAVETAPQPVRELRPEPKTVIVPAKVLAESLAAFAYALAAHGAESLSSEGRAAFRALLGDLDAASGAPAAHHEIPAESAFQISRDLLANRHRRSSLTSGEVMLGQAVAQQTPKLAQRLGVAVPGRGAATGGGRTERAEIVSPVLITEPTNARFPQGQHFDAMGRPTGPRRVIRGTV